MAWPSLGATSLPHFGGDMLFEQDQHVLYGPENISILGVEMPVSVLSMWEFWLASAVILAAFVFYVRSRYRRD